MILADIVSAGWVWGIVIAGLLALCCVVAIIWGIRFEKSDRYSNGGGYVVAGLAAICLLVVGAGWLWGSWPLAYEYHHWVDKQGKVEAVGHRIISNGDNGINDRYVFRLDGRAYGVDDTRASLTRVGDMVHLRCKKEHQFFQHWEDDGWACRWVND